MHIFVWKHFQFKRQSHAGIRTACPDFAFAMILADLAWSFCEIKGWMDG